MNRPQGVTVLGWIAIVFGAIGFIASVMGVIGLMALSAGVVGVGGVVGGAAIAGSALLLVALFVGTAVLSLVEVAFGVGALQLKPWAWSLGMIWSWVSIATSIISVVANGGDGILNAIISVLVAIGILYYLYTDEVRAAFDKTDKVPPGFAAPVFEQIEKMISGSKSGTRPHTPGAPPMQ